MSKDHLQHENPSEMKQTWTEKGAQKVNITIYIMYLEHLYGLWSSANPGVHDPLCESLDQIVSTWGEARASLNLPTILLKCALAFAYLAAVAGRCFS